MRELTTLYSQETEQFWERRLRVPEKTMRRIRRLLYKNYTPLEEVIAAEGLPELAETCQSSFLTLVEKQTSERDGATKLLFRTEDGLIIETVILRIATGRTTLCVSSQVGCTEKCSFCSTGAMGFKRNLSESEIIDQVVKAQRILEEEDRRASNIVFMGMGEPLRNFDNVSKALEFIISPAHLQFSPRKVTVSTLGVPEKMLELARNFPQVQLALSLNAADDATRTRVMPINELHPMEELRQALAEIQELRGGEVMLEYIMFRDENDSLADAANVLQFTRDINARVNLIPYNDSDGRFPFKPSSYETIEAFSDFLKEAGLLVTRRYSLGQDIAAACGQLADKKSKEAKKIRRV